MTQKTDFLIVGTGIIGLSVGLKIRQRFPDAGITLIDKEPDIALHASGRNSGVLHAGFYYTADSLKARFTIEGNRAIKAYCRQKGIPVNECGKLVVAQNEAELQGLYELEKRGRANGSTVSIISEAEARDIEPNVLTFQKALNSPETASLDPVRLCQSLRENLAGQGCTFHFNTRYRGHTREIIHTSAGDFQAKTLINCAGLYADEIAHDYGLGRDLIILPFKGLYLKYTKNTTDIRTNIYPVPNLRNPFLGVHFTKTVAGEIKIGPTAIPAFWRENYAGLSNFNIKEAGQITAQMSRLLLTNAFHFRDLALEEGRKYNRRYFIGLASAMVRSIDPAGFTETTRPGIRAQLLNTKSLTLVQDFMIEQGPASLHILNAVSPALTCSFPFANYIVENYLNK